MEKKSCLCKKDCKSKKHNITMPDCYAEKAVEIGGDKSKGIRKALDEYKGKDNEEQDWF